MEVLSGKGYIEVKLAGINKGVAVSKILSKISKIRGDPDFILCMGDDRSDEDMFEIINGLSSQDRDEEVSGDTSDPEVRSSSSHGNINKFAQRNQRSLGGLAGG